MQYKKTKNIYEQPTIKVVSFVVEGGFQDSGGEGIIPVESGVAAENLNVQSDNNQVSGGWLINGESIY